MKGNIFSIEVFIIAILIVSIISFVYTIPSPQINNNFPTLKVESDAINTFYFGTTEENNEAPSKNRICQKIFYYTDLNTIGEKNICEEIK